MANLSRAILLMMLTGGSSLAFGAQTALVIIDMQSFHAEKHGYHRNALSARRLENAVLRQRELIRLAKSHDMPIVVAELEPRPATRADLVAEIGDYPKALTVRKRRNDVFSTFGGALGPLRKFLDDNFVEELVITGANGGACVKDSIEGAIENGYRVWADEAGIIDFNTAIFVHPYRFEHTDLSVDDRLETFAFVSGSAVQRFAEGSEAWSTGHPPRPVGWVDDMHRNSLGDEFAALWSDPVPRAPSRASCEPNLR